MCKRRIVHRLYLNIVKIMKFLMVYKYDQIDYFINQKNREKLERLLYSKMLVQYINR